MFAETTNSLPPYTHWVPPREIEESTCDDAAIMSSGVGGAKSYAQRLQAKGMKSAEMVSVNMHKLGESFVEM